MAHMPSAPCPRVRSFTLRGGPGARGGGREQGRPGLQLWPTGAALGPRKGRRDGRVWGLRLGLGVGPRRAVEGTPQSGR